MLLRLASYNALFYGLTATVFLGFTVVFSRQYGTEAYAAFSILLNSLAAILLINNYQGFLVGYSVADSRHAVRRYLRYAVPYTGAAALAATAIFVLTTRLPAAKAPLAALVFGLMFAATLPSTAILATRENWRLTGYRAAYQILIVAVFYILYVAGLGLDTAFLLAAAAAAGTLFALVLRRALGTLRAAPSAHPDAPGSVILVAAWANGALMLTQLIDKLAISYLDVGPGRACIGIYFIYYDVVFRVSTVYLMLVYPLTFAFLTRLRTGAPITPTLAAMGAGITATAAAVIAGGYLVVPPVYGISLDCAPLLPLLMGLAMGFTGVFYLVVAFCNAARANRMLAVQNVAVLLAMTAAVAVVAATLPGGLTVTRLALILTLGKAGAVITLAVILVRLLRRRTPIAALPGPAPAADAA